MKRFFNALNFPRTMILGSLIGCLITGWFVYHKRAELKQLERDVLFAPALVADIQMKAQELDQLMKAANRDLLQGEGENEIDFYIRKRAGGPNINIGQVDLNFSSTEPFKGVEDIVYKIKPSERSSRFLRGSVANFLFKLEQESRRIKVTSLKLEPFERTKAGEIGDDFWTFEAEITSRRAIE